MFRELKEKIIRTQFADFWKQTGRRADCFRLVRTQLLWIIIYVMRAVKPFIIITLNETCGPSTRSSLLNCASSTRLPPPHDSRPFYFSPPSLTHRKSRSVYILRWALFFKIQICSYFTYPLFSFFFFSFSYEWLIRLLDSFYSNLFYIPFM